MRPWTWIGALAILAVALTWWARRKLARMEAAGDIAPLWPVPGYHQVTSGFGPRNAPLAGASTMHNGIDIAAPIGARVVAPWDGTVKSVYSNAGGGNQLIIEHDNGHRTGYAHLDSTLVAPGQRVTRGQDVAKVGNTGNSTGPHLHFTVRPPSLTGLAAHIDPASLNYA